MSLLLTFANLGFTSTLRVDDPSLEELARDLHTAARVAMATCEPDTPSDITWQPVASGGWRILLRNNPWLEIPLNNIPICQTELSEANSPLESELVTERPNTSLPPFGHPLPSSDEGRGDIGNAEHLFLHSDGLLDDLTREKCGDAPLLHAGGVVDGKGRGVVVCGSSGAGKTSVVLACLLQGWDWLGDEWLCFRSPEAYYAEGFRRNFNLKERSFGDFPETSQSIGVRELLLPRAGCHVRFF